MNLTEDNAIPDDVDGKEERAHFVAPAIQDNPDGWGPCELPDQFKDMPYQPFSKGDRLGKVRHMPRNYFKPHLIHSPVLMLILQCHRSQIGQDRLSKIRNSRVS